MGLHRVQPAPAVSVSRQCTYSHLCLWKRILHSLAWKQSRYRYTAEAKEVQDLGESMSKQEDRPIIAPGLTLPEFGPVTVETKGYEVTQKCADCGLVLFRYHQPPNMP